MMPNRVRSRFEHRVGYSNQNATLTENLKVITAQRKLGNL